METTSTLVTVFELHTPTTDVTLKASPETLSVLGVLVLVLFFLPFLKKLLDHIS